MSYLNTQHTRSSRIFRFTSLVAMFSAACLTLPQVSGAQTLVDWQKAQEAASKNQGPESIPYVDFQKAAKDNQVLVGELCKTEAWNCDALGTKSIRETIKGLTFKIGESETKLVELNKTMLAAKTDAEKQVSQESINAVKKEIERMALLLAEKKQRLETDLKDIDGRISKGNDCLKARNAVQDAYKQAYDRARLGESDPAIKVIVNELTAFWEKGRQSHQTSFDNTNNGIKKCQACKNGDL